MVEYLVENIDYKQLPFREGISEKIGGIYVKQSAVEWICRKPLA